MSDIVPTLYWHVRLQDSLQECPFHSQKGFFGQNFKKKVKGLPHPFANFDEIFNKCKDVNPSFFCNFFFLKTKQKFRKLHVFKFCKKAY